MSQPALKVPSLKLLSRPKHLRSAEETEKWRFELIRPYQANQCVLTIDLHAHQPAPGKEAHFAHWGYILEASEDHYSLEFNQAGKVVSLTLNGVALEVYKQEWLPHSGNGFYEWRVGWSELGDGGQTSVTRGQALMFEPETDEVSLLFDCWPDHDRRDPGPEAMARRILLRLKQEMQSLSKALPTDALILDFGCGNKPYYPFFHGHCLDYVGVDIVDGFLVDYIYDGGVSLPDDSFHLVICTQVLEHTRDPHRVSSEIWRLLRPGGRAFVSEPFCWHYHPWPNDYWRFTAEGLAILFEQFDELHMERDCDTIHTLLQEFGFLLSRVGYSDPNFLRLLNKLGEESNAFVDDKLPAHFLVWLKK